MQPAPPDPWPILHSRFRDHAFFFHTPVVERITPSSLILRHNRLTRALLFCGMFALGAGMFAAPLLPEPRTPSDHLIPTSVVRVLGPVMGLFIAGATVHALFEHRRIDLDRRHGVLRVSFGRRHRTAMELRLADCVLTLEPIRGSEDVSAALLLRGKEDACYMRLLSSKWRESLLPLFETLRPLFGPGAADHTIADTNSLPVTPMRVSADRGRSHSIRFDEAAGTATLRRAGTGLLAVFLIVLLGAGLVAIGVFFVSPNPFTPVPIALGVLLLVGTLCAHRQHMTVDRRSGITLPRSAIKEGAFPSTMLGATDIAAVQLCSLRRAGEHLHVGYAPIQLRSYTSYQINLVTARPPNGRIHLLSDSNRARAERVAQQLAEFLAKPLLDHR